MQNNKDSRDFRNALGAFPTGVTVVTAIDKNGNPIGFTANSFTSASLDPRIILICIDKASINLDVFKDGEAFAVNVLSESQQQISTTFATPVEDRFSQIDWTISSQGSPLINNSVAWFDCKTKKILDAGDHYILLGNVKDFNSGASTPLVFLRGNYVNLALEQKMLRSMESGDKQIMVGLIIECQKKIFLLEDKNKDSLLLPTSNRLGSYNDSGSLLSDLKIIGVSVPEYYLFSVFENQNDKSTLIFYRARIEDSFTAIKGKFFDFNDIPLDKIKDDAVQSMLERYIGERDLNAFGIYVGKDDSGKVEPGNKLLDLDNEGY
jgi:flavin reductase (DIM6/NTAB) family NADH-FMN oxidoreductase RutF